MEIKTMSVVFKNRLSFREVPLLRGALLHLANGDSTLFHDHIGDKLRYRYPLVQYRESGGYASLFCLGDGVVAVEGLLCAASSAEVRIGRREEKLLVDSETRLNDELSLSDVFQEYTIRRYLPLNQENYAKYKATDSIVDRYQMIEKCLVGNILSFAKSMGMFFEQQIKVKIQDVANTHEYTYKKVRMLGFDLKFKANVSLPRHIALGKGVSIGFGEIF